MKQFIFFLERIPNAVGEMILLTDRDGMIRAIDWEGYEARMHKLLRLHYGQDRAALSEAKSPSEARRRLGQYLDGDIRAIERLPTATGGAKFQRQVWDALRGIPAGATVTYGELARRIGNPSAVRAVGLANGANPVAVVVPCHRVIGANASLTGYGGGLHRKHWLLKHEGAAATAVKIDALSRETMEQLF